MQVALVCTPGARCGITEYTKALAEALSGMVRPSIVILPSLARRDLVRSAAVINQADIAHIQFHHDFFGDWRAPSRLHAFQFLLQRLTVPIVITVHDLIHGLRRRAWDSVSLKRMVYNLGAVPFVNHTPYGRFLLGRFLDPAAHLIVHCHATKQFLLSLGISDARLSVCYPGVPDLGVATEDVRAQRGWQGRRLVTMFGFIRPGKGYDLAVRALASLPEDVLLLLAGVPTCESEARYLDTLQALATSLGVGGRLVVTGYVESSAVGAYLKASDVILLVYRACTAMSVSASLGYALASQRPVIATATPYFREVHERYAAFTLVPEEDPPALAEAIRRILEQASPELPTARGAQQFCEEWRWPRVAERTYQIYQQCLDRSP